MNRVFRTSARARKPRLLTMLVAVMAFVLATPQMAYAAVSNTPDPTVQVQGIVYSAVHLNSGSTLVGGDFSGIGSHPTRNVGLLNSNHLADKGFKVTTDGIVYAVAANADESVIYLGGTFTQVNGEPRAGLAAVTNVGDNRGALLPWRAETNGAVRAMEMVGNTVYVGGSFTYINGSRTGRLVAIDTTSGAVSTTFRPFPDWTVRDIDATPNVTDKLYVSGGFNRIGGQARDSAAEILTSDGTATGFTPDTNTDVGLAVNVTPDGSRMFFSVPNNEIYAYDLASSQRVWTTKGGGDTQAIESTDSEVFIGGHFRNITTWRVKRNMVASLNVSNGEPTAWNPHISGNMGPWSIHLNAGKLVVGGDFGWIGGQPRKGLGRFTVTSP